MGRLGDFLGAFAGSLGNQMAEKRKLEQQNEMEVAREKRQLNYLKASEALRARNQAILNPTTRQGAPVQRGPGNWVVPTEERVPEFDGDNLTGASWRPAGETAAPPPKPIKVGDRLVEQGYDGTIRDLIEPREKPMTEYERERIGVLKAKGTGAGKAPRAAYQTFDGRRWQVDPVTGDKIRDMGSASGPDGGLSREATNSEVRDRMKDVRADIADISTEVDPETGRSEWDDYVQSRQYPVGITKTDFRELERKRLAKEVGGERAQGKPSYADAAAQVAARRPDLSPEDIKQYLASKGIRP